MAPPAPRRRPAGNLPADLTTFVGRRAELTAVRRLAGESRLVTLTGFGGVGKTRLAIRTASDLYRAFPGGVWLVELAALDNTTLLPDTVAKAVGLHGQSPASTLDALIEHFSQQATLLVFDNCEHVIDSAATLLATLLRECPNLHVLATSREALGIIGEVVFPVAPLPVPPEGPLGNATEWDAITLFLERARVAVPGFALTAENRDAVFGICRGLGGIPLALELAAVRLRALSPAQLFDRLADHLRLLTSGNRSAPDRQRTLRGCIEWSYQLCTPAERDIWAATSVFAGGFELDAAEAVCGDIGLDAAAVVDGVLSLVDRSVLTKQTRGDATWYWTLESLRQFGLEHLRDPTQVLRRHQDYYFELAIRSEAESVTKTQRATMDRLRREHANLRAAFGFSLGAGCADQGLEAAGHLREHWIGIGALAEGRHWLERLLAAAQATPASRARALRGVAWLATLQGDLTAAESFLGELRALVETGGADDDVSIAFLHETSGNYALYTGDPGRTVEECRIAVPVFEAHGELANAIATQVLLQMALSRAGELGAALELHAICMETTELTGDAWFRSYSLWQAGLTHLQQGDAATAIASLQAGLRLKDRLIDAMGIALCLEGLAWATSATNDWYRAAVLFGAATARWSELGLRAADLPHTADAHVACDAALREAMSRHEFSTTAGTGMEMSTEDAVAFALDESPVTAAPESPVPSPLTRRQHEVAELVARGLSNKEIAGALVISPRTAEAHVEHILVKLGFTTRAQIAAWVAATPAVR